MRKAQQFLKKCYGKVLSIKDGKNTTIFHPYAADWCTIKWATTWISGWPDDYNKKHYSMQKSVQNAIVCLQFHTWNHTLKEIIHFHIKPFCFNFNFFLVQPLWFGLNETTNSSMDILLAWLEALKPNHNSILLIVYNLHHCPTYGVISTLVPVQSFAAFSLESFPKKHFQFMILFWKLTTNIWNLSSLLFLKMHQNTFALWIIFLYSQTLIWTALIICVKFALYWYRWVNWIYIYQF